MQTLTLAWHRTPGDPLPADRDIDENQLALRADGRTIGYANIIDCTHHVWIEYIEVNAPRQGHGSWLLAAVLDAFPGRVFALSASGPLVRWYEKFGFVPGRIDGENCLVRAARPAPGVNVGAYRRSSAATDGAA